MVSVLLFASVERFGVSHMEDFSLKAGHAGKTSGISHAPTNFIMLLDHAQGVLRGSSCQWFIS